VKPLVYIAGPYTNPDPVFNTHEAIKWGETIENFGVDVVVPHLSLLWHIVSPAPVEKWYARDLAVLAKCDALFRFPGASSGADAEVVFAAERGIPVFLDNGYQFGDWLFKWKENH
jgi:nucleoside 2-deoxyribosyltransferase